VFEELDPLLEHKIATAMRLVRYNDGEAITEPGQHALSFYILKAGI
jgi:hypothetical protein